MIRPIIGYGHPVLREKTEEVGPDYPNLKQLLEDMWETMYAAEGVGLAAPQIGVPARIFVIDPGLIDEELKDHKRAMINPQVLESSRETWPYEEGCLSIPGIREKITREERVLMEWEDEQFEVHEQWFEGISARVILHEYDHLEGILFPDRLSSLKKRLLKRRLDSISRGNVRADYRMKFANTKL